MLTVALIFLFAPTGQAIIDPNFTPRDLTEQSKLVMVGEVGRAGKTWTLRCIRLLTGEAPKQHVLSLARCNVDQVEDITGALQQNKKQPVILFAGTLRNVEAAYLHVDGTWLALKATAKGRWNVSGYATRLSATFAGGTDMLIRMADYIVKADDPTVPVSAGVDWADEPIKVGKIGGRTAGMKAVALGAKKTLHLFVSCSKGDKLFRADTDPDELETTFKDVTAAVGLDTKSQAFRWHDVNGDGLADLVCWDGAALTVRLNSADGTLRKAGGGWTLRLDSGCRAIVPCAVGGKIGMLVDGEAGPQLFAAGQGGWKKGLLPAAEGMGHTGSAPCIVADLDNDGYPDLLQPGGAEGLLWKGGAGGFARPVRTAVCTGGGGAKVAVADFNADGLLDIFLAGEVKNRLWENDGKGGFKDVFRHSGSMSYKCPTGAAEVQATDLNHDGRADLCFVYRTQGILYHFSRGYRAFGEEGEVRLSGAESEPGQPRIGQLAMAFADFDLSHSQDLAVLLTTGEVQVYLNNQMDQPGMRLRLPVKTAGAVTASCWQGAKFPVCIGTTVVTGHSPAAYVAARFPGFVTVKWRLPGGPEQSKKIEVENGPVNVILGSGGAK